MVTKQRSRYSRSPANLRKAKVIWCIVGSAEDCLEPVALFDYQPGRGQEYPKAFLDGYKGMLMMSDGYNAWRTLKKATHFECMPHARRMFTDLLKGQKNKSSPRVAKALEYFQALYQVEALAKGKLARR